MRTSIADGAIVYRQACALGCEGIVSKRLGSPYRSGRADCWLKVKNPAALALGSPSGYAPRGRRPAPAPTSAAPPTDRPVALADKVARVAQAVTAMGERYRGIRSRFARVLAPG